MNPERLAKLQSQVRIGGKGKFILYTSALNQAIVLIFGKLGTPRRKVKKITKSAGTDDRKLQATLQKLSVQPMMAMLSTLPTPRVSLKLKTHVCDFTFHDSIFISTLVFLLIVHAAINSNTYAVYGRAQEKELTELGVYNYN
jgi:nascent polypeptide-associated complex subunit beta